MLLVRATKDKRFQRQISFLRDENNELINTSSEVSQLSKSWKYKLYSQECSGRQEAIRSFLGKTEMPQVTGL